jgi:WD40 repeat protein
VFSPDGKTLAVACNDGNVRLYDTLTWSIRHTTASRATKRAPQCAFSPNGRLLAVSADGGAVCAYDWRDPELATPTGTAPADLERRWAALGSADGATA